MLESIAHKVRLVLNDYAATNPRGIFANFPNGSCRDSAYLLLKYSKEKGLKGICLVSAEAGGSLKRTTHAWLEKDGYIIDITADQFNNRDRKKMPGVFVSRDRSWHDKYFSRQTPESGVIFDAGFNNYFSNEKVLAAKLEVQIDNQK